MLLAALLARVRGGASDAPGIMGGVRGIQALEMMMRCDVTVAFGYAAWRVAARSTPTR